MRVSVFLGFALLCVPLLPGWAQSVVATVPVGIEPAAVAVNTLTNKVYVAGGGVVTVIDGETNRTATIPVGSRPVAIEVNAVTNKIYVVNQGIPLRNIRGSVTEIDGVSNSTVTIRDPHATFPIAVGVNPVTDKIYVTNFNGNVTVIDGRTRLTTTLTDRNGAFAYPIAVAVNSVTNKIYVASVNNGSVAIIDGLTNSITSVPVTDRNVLSPVALAINSVTNKIYVANNGLLRNTSNAGNITVIDGRTDSTTVITNPHAVSPVAVAANSATNKIYVANSGVATVALVTHGNVTVLDGATNAISTVTDPKGVTPQNVAVNSFNNKIYVANDGSNVTVINGRTNSFVTVTNPRAQASVGAPLAVDPVTDRIYTANCIAIT